MIEEERTIFKNEQISKPELQIHNPLHKGYKICIIIWVVVFVSTTYINVLELNGFRIKSMKNIMQNLYSDTFEQEINQKLIAQNLQQYLISHKNILDSKIQNQNLAQGFQIKPIPVNTTKRISMSSPASYGRNMRIVSIFKKQNSQKHLCLLTNGVNFISNVTINTAQAILTQSNFNRWILILDGYDLFADQLWSKFFKEQKSNLGLQYMQKNMTIDSDYQFIRYFTKNCSDIVFIQSYFKISNHNANKISTLLTSNVKQKKNVYYSSKANIAGTQQNLINLQTTNLESISTIQISKYLFIFDADYINAITPLNFAYYARYIIEELFIYPILAIAQGSPHLIELKQSLHEFDESAVQFKQFSIKQIQKNQFKTQYKPICFVSYPINPYKLSQTDLVAYFKDLTQVQHIQNSIIVINLPYKFNSSERNQLWESFSLISESISKGISIRLRIRANKTVCSLATYQAAYTYCHNSATMITSRHNIEFNKDFLQILGSNAYIRYSFYYTNHFSSDNLIVNLDKDKPLEYKRKQFRTQAMYYEEYFMNVQIFQSDLFKMIYFWILKSDEVDFYQTQASFVLPMLEMIRLGINIIPMPLYKISQVRVTSQMEKQQLQSIKMYYEWPEIPNNRLIPFTHNSLENIAFRRNAPEKISKFLHQIWLGKQQISPFQLKLHQTLIQTNKDFQMILWKQQNITIQNFPLTYALVRRSLEYQIHSNRSYLAPIAAIIRYECLYQNGGIYLDFKAQGRKPLNPFLKYELFFIDADYEKDHYGHPANVGNGIIGAIKHNYHLRLTLTELIRQEKFDYSLTEFPKMVGGFVLRKSFTDTELFTHVGFGFHLFSQKPGTGKPNMCSYSYRQINRIEEDQQKFEVSNSMGRTYLIGIPCKIYKQAYVVLYKLLAGSWKVKQPSGIEKFIKKIL